VALALTVEPDDALPILKLIIAFPPESVLSELVVVVVLQYFVNITAAFVRGMQRADGN
jgi:hypothetical protein